MGPRLVGGRAQGPGSELRPRVLQPHDDLQLARLPCGIGTVRLHRWHASRPADRELAGSRGHRVAGRQCLPAGLSPPRKAPSQLTVEKPGPEERSASVIRQPRAPMVGVNRHRFETAPRFWLFGTTTRFLRPRPAEPANAITVEA